MREKPRIPKKEAPAGTKVPREKAKKVKPLRRFKAEAELIARQSFVLETEAPSVSEAKKQIHAQLAELNLDSKSAKTTRHLKKITQLK